MNVVSIKMSLIAFTIEKAIISALDIISCPDSLIKMSLLTHTDSIIKHYFIGEKNGASP